MSTEKPKLFSTSYIIAFITSTMVFMSNFLLVSLIPLHLSEKMGTSRSEIGTVLGLSSVGILILRPTMGFVLDKWGRKNFLSLSLFLLGFANLSFLFARTPMAILLLRIFQIIPFAASSTALTTIASDVIPIERRGEGLSIFTSASTLALAIGPAVGIALYKGAWYGTPFVVSAIGGFLCFIFSFAIKIPKLKQPNLKFKFKSLFDRHVLVISAFVALGYMGIVGLISYGTLYASEINLPHSKVSFAITLFSFGLISLRLLTAKVMDRDGPFKSGILSMVMFSLGLGIIGIIRNSTGLYIGSFIMGGGVGILLPIGLAMAMDLVNPAKKGVCTGLIYSGIDIANSLGAMLFGYFGEIFQSFGATFLLFSIIELLGVFLFIFLIYPYYKKEKIRILLLNSEEFENEMQNRIPVINFND